MPPFKKVLQRAEARLRSGNLPLSTTPTQFVVISNGGVMNNIRKGELERFIGRFGNIGENGEVIEILLPKRKAYAIFHLRNLELAEKIIEETQKTEHFIKGIYYK